jgi:HD-GYP domain-containing protein (c-di-GMP phosphodiesterase class II)
MNAVFPPPKPARSGDPLAGGAAWLVLERLIEALQANESTAQQIRRTLHEVREALDADVTYFFPGLSGEAFELDGQPILPASWCQQFTLRTLGSSPGVDRELVRCNVPPLEDSGKEFKPSSVAMVRLSRTHSSWLAVLSFRPERQFRPADVRLLALFRKVLLNQRQHAREREEWQATLLGLIHCLVNAIDARDAHLAGRSERVARIAVRLGRELELSPAVQSDLYLAGLMHDIGRIGIRDDVLRKPEPLTPDELAHVREHPVIGDRILATIPTLAHLRAGVRHHHEHYDGRGYPDGLAGADIPLLARVLAVADACEAMMSPRPYRDALPPERVAARLAEGAGRQWDPAVVEAFRACGRDVCAIRQRGVGDSVVRALKRRENELDLSGGKSAGTAEF